MSFLYCTTETLGPVFPEMISRHTGEGRALSARDGAEMTRACPFDVVTAKEASLPTTVLTLPNKIINMDFLL